MNDKYNSFEEAFEVLKKTVSGFENAKTLNLDDVVNNYQIGIEAYNYCVEKLDDAKKRIKIIGSGENV